MFLMVGQGSDPCLQEVQSELRARGRQVGILDPRQPGAYRFTWQLGGAKPQTAAMLVLGGKRVQAAQIKGVLLRQEWLGAASSLPDPDDAAYAHIESHGALASFFYSLSVPVIDRPRFTYQRGPLLTGPEIGPAIACCGFDVQRTLVTTRLEAALRFLEENGSHALLGGLADTTVQMPLRPPTAEQDLRAALEHGPVRLAQRLRATALRVFIVGSQVFAERASAPWHPDDEPAARKAQTFAPFPVSLPLASQCGRLAAVLDRRFIQLYLAESQDESYACCGILTTPQFQTCRSETREAIARALAALLEDEEGA